MPPAQNPTYIKASDQGFYLSLTDSQFFTVAGLQAEIANLQADIDARAIHLQNAAGLGVADAVTLVATLTTQPLSSVLTNAPSLSTVLTPPTPVTPT